MKFTSSDPFRPYLIEKVIWEGGGGVNGTIFESKQLLINYY